MSHHSGKKKQGPVQAKASGQSSGNNELHPAKATQILRDKIIASITSKPCKAYQLASLLWDAAARCFPSGGPHKWDGAWFYLDLSTGGLYAEVSTYPDQFGASYQDTIPLSAEGFHQIAQRKDFSPELRCFKTEEDWARLFDNRLKAAAADSLAEVQRWEDEKKEKWRKENLIHIPSGLAARSPSMDVIRVMLTLKQRYARTELTLSRDQNAYVLNYESVPISTSGSNTILSQAARAAEASWIEDRIEAAINDPDASTWVSLPGGDTMDIKIQRENHQDILMEYVKPIRKYSNLLSDLGKLVQYGSEISDDTIA